MFDLSPIALVTAVMWTMACITAAALVARRSSAQRKAPRPYTPPLRLINGLILLGLAPAVSLLHFAVSQHRAYWGGAGVLLAGLLLIASQAIERQQRGPSESAAMTFREKSIAAQFAAILLVYGFFGFRLWGQNLTPVAAIAVLIGTTVLTTAVSIVAHLTIALTAKREKRDERDVVVELRGSRNAYYALAAGVWCILLLAIAPTHAGILFYASLGAFALAELVRLGSQLVYYRLGM